MTTFLNPLDSAFILLEVPGSAMNIGAVIELDFGDVADPGERFAMIRKNIGDRLHEIPVLTKRIVRAPFDLTWPVLVPEEHFDLDRHVLRVSNRLGIARSEDPERVEQQLTGARLRLGALGCPQGAPGPLEEHRPHHPRLRSCAILL